MRGSASNGDYLLLADLLLAGDGATGSLAGARVGVRALPVNRETAAVTQPLVAADLDLALDVRGDLAAEVTLDAIAGLDVVAESHDVLVAEVLDPRLGAHAGRGQGLERAGAADSEDVGEGDLNALVAREVDADETCHVGGVPSCRSPSR